MPRHARRLSRSGYYHIIIRGVNKQNIFNDDSDREKFIQCMKKYKQKSGIEIVVYCLMSNHVHIMMKALDGPSDFMKKHDDCEIMEYDTCVKKNTESIIKTILAESNIRDIRAFALVEQRQQREVLQKVYEEGVSERQVSNITGLSRTYLRKIISL